MARVPTKSAPTPIAAMVSQDPFTSAALGTVLAGTFDVTVSGDRASVIAAWRKAGRRGDTFKNMLLVV